MLFDVMPGRPELAGFAGAAAGAGDSFSGAFDDQVLGVLCAWDRLEAHAAARKHAAVAELIRRRPAPGYPLAGNARPSTPRCQYAAPFLTSEFALDALAGMR
jgi:hypothetical protein